MKHPRKVDVNARIFSQALQSALRTGSLSRKDRIASNKNLQLTEEKPAPTIDSPNIARLKSGEEMAPCFGNLNQVANDIVETSSSLVTNAFEPQPWLEKNHLSSIQETCVENLKIPEDQSAFTTYWPGMQETKFSEDLSQSLNIPKHSEINDNEYNFPANHLESVPSWMTDPSYLHNLVHNSYLDSLDDALRMVPANENDAWIRNNRLMALQQIGSNTLDQYSSSISLSPPYTIGTTGEMLPDTVHILPGSWDSPTVLPQSSTNSLASESNSLKDMPVYDGKYKFESPITHQQKEMMLELSKKMNISKNQKSTQENFDFRSEGQAVCINNGRTELACKNRSNSFEKSHPLQNLQMPNSKSESSSVNCCETFHDKPSPKNKKNTVRLPSYDAKSLMTLGSSTGFYDSHCHLDLMFGRKNFHGTYADYMTEHKDTFPKSYKGCIAVFCKPFTFAKKHLWEKHLKQDNVWGAFGCHPKSAKFYNAKIERDLEAALDHPKVKALGEIGLDYSIGDESSRLEQQYVFRRQLAIAQKRKLRLVIHCRDADDDTIKIMHEIVPKDTIFHLHCFTGNWEKAQMWIREFPHVFIGITNLVTFPSAVETHEVARNLLLDNLLLETDAPYFVPSMAPRGTHSSHPGMAIHVAAQIAALRDIPLETVLQWTSANTKIVYKLP